MKFLETDKLIQNTATTMKKVQSEQNRLSQACVSIKGELD